MTEVKRHKFTALLKVGNYEGVRQKRDRETDIKRKDRVSDSDSLTDSYNIMFICRL